MSTDIKLSKPQMSKMILSSGFLCNRSGYFGKKVRTDLVIPLCRDNLPGLVSNLALNAIRKISGKGAVKVGKGFTLLISNEDMNDMIKIIKSFEDLGALIDGVIETVKYEIKNQKRRFLGILLATFSHFSSATSDFFSSKMY